MGHLDQTAEQWLAARKIIAEALIFITRVNDLATANRNAEAIIARLANNDPPILLAYQSQLKE